MAAMAIDVLVAAVIVVVAVQILFEDQVQPRDMTTV
jgi:hypothetical protein